MNRDIILQAKAMEATDIHIVPGENLRFRCYGNLRVIDCVEEEDVWEIWWRSIADENNVKQLQENGATELACYYGCSLRVSLFKVNGRVEGSIRLLRNLDGIPADPNPQLLEDIAWLQDGLVLIGGSTGSGKTTTLMRILDIINRERALHIITLEDPPEFDLHSKLSCIRRRQIGRDVPDFAMGLRSALREDPDVIVLGELRSPESIAAALLAAETGHLVMATVHGGNVADVVGRMVHAFPAERHAEIRCQLASTLRIVAAQRLFMLEPDCLLLREYAYWNGALSNLVREGKEAQLQSYLQTMGKGAQTWQKAVANLLNADLSYAIKKRLRSLVE